MIRLFSWNVQCGLGCDKINDLGRIADYIRQQGLPELICLQEISRNMAGFSASGQEDQLAYLRGLFPEYSLHWGSGTSWLHGSGVREEFGNLTLSRIPVQLRQVHLLPRPPANGEPQMQRVAVEVIVPVGDSMLRVLNCHLAYHVRRERRSQLEWLSHYRQTQEEACARGPRKMDGAYSHFLPVVSTVLCGDLNFPPESDDYAYLASQGWLDSWKILHPTLPHASTCGIYDHEMWPEGEHCRDYFWLNGECRFVPAGLSVDRETSYSDHQPIILSLEKA